MNEGYLGDVTRTKPLHSERKPGSGSNGASARKGKNLLKIGEGDPTIQATLAELRGGADPHAQGIHGAEITHTLPPEEGSAARVELDRKETHPEEESNPNPKKRAAEEIALLEGILAHLDKKGTVQDAAEKAAEPVPTPESVTKSIKPETPTDLTTFLRDVKIGGLSPKQREDLEALGKALEAQMSTEKVTSATNAGSKESGKHSKPTTLAELQRLLGDIERRGLSQKLRVELQNKINKKEQPSEEVKTEEIKPAWKPATTPDEIVQLEKGAARERHTSTLLRDQGKWKPVVSNPEKEKDARERKNIQPLPEKPSFEFDRTQLELLGLAPDEITELLKRPKEAWEPPTTEAGFSRIERGAAVERFAAMMAYNKREKEKLERHIQENDKPWFEKINKNLDTAAHWYKKLPLKVKIPIGIGLLGVSVGGALAGGAFGATICGVSFAGSRALGYLGAWSLANTAIPEKYKETRTARLLQHAGAATVALALPKTVQILQERYGLGDLVKSYIPSWLGGIPASPTAPQTLASQIPPPEALQEIRSQEFLQTETFEPQPPTPYTPPPPGLPQLEDQPLFETPPTLASQIPNPDILPPVTPEELHRPFLGTEPLVVKAGDNVSKLLEARLDSLPEFKGLSGAGKKFAIASYIKHLESLPLRELRDLGFKTSNIHKIWEGNNLSAILDPAKLSKPFNFTEVLATIARRGI